MTGHVGQLIVHDRELHLEPYDDVLIVGDTVEVIRGNGPREGERMGTATITGFEAGSPVLSIRFDGRELDYAEVLR